MLVDFQLINYGHPAYDILYLLYVSGDTAFRDAHMQAWCSSQVRRASRENSVRLSLVFVGL